MSDLLVRIKAWASELNAHAEWASALNQAFDAIGFTEGYVARARTSTQCVPLHIKDNVWGMIEVDPTSVVLVNSPLLQRLRSISQLGFTFLTYPTAHHSRFEHSLGIYYVVRRLIDSFDSTARAETRPDADVVAVALSEDESLLVRHAALLHDTGHAAFSHASERIFEKYKKRFKIGPFSVEEFKRRMQFHMHGLNSPGQKSVARGSKLAEALTVALLMSERFTRFYERCVSPGGGENLAKIGALVMGRPPTPKNRALSQIISGAIDADKIDYMTRDARACGIPLGVDVSRVFLRAGVYDVRSKEKLTELAESEDFKEPPVKIFVIDQSGTDTLEELGLGRVSMFSRVYHHQFTRNIERQYEELLLSVERNAYANGRYSDFLRLWSLPEDVVLHSLRSDNEAPPEVAERASLLANRELSKRASCYGINEFRKSLPEILNDQDVGTKALEKEISETISQINTHDKDGTSPLVEQVSTECQTIKERLDSLPHATNELPSGKRPRDLWIIPQPESRDYQLGRAFVLTADRTVKQTEARLASYLDAGAIPSQRGYVLVEHDWRYIAALAFQQTVYKGYRRNYTVNLQPAGSSNSVTINAYHRPVLNLSSTAHRCKLHLDRLEAIQQRLANTGYYDDAPTLVSYKDTEVIRRIQKQFATFQSQGGWLITENSVKRFLEQFPPQLRDAAVRLLGSIEYLDNVSITKYLEKAIGRLRVPNRKYHLVPFTPSSGQLLRTIIRSHYDQSPETVVHATLEEALSTIAQTRGRNGKRQEHQIIFFDDHVASGTQASAQLHVWMKNSKPSNRVDAATTGTAAPVPTDENIFKVPLSTAHQTLLAKIPISFAFCVALQAGKQRIFDAATELDLQLGTDAVQSARDLAEVSGKNSTDADLREFLRTVGRGVIEYYRQRTRPDEDEPRRRAKIQNRALGYDDLEGLVVTFMNVPSSTYTALWCPGYYCPAGSVSHDEHSALPWQPLFLRRGALDYVVLG